jgi:glucan phosphoethanolaminetransferase (alkaline phosphatase superfamily)
MIQRRQSIYLLAIAIICAVLLFSDLVFYKVSGNLADNPNTFQIAVDYNSAESGEDHIGRNDTLMYFLAATGLVALVSIFLYNNRKLQSKLVLALFVLAVVIYIGMYKASYGIEYVSQNVQHEVTVGAFVPVSILLLAFLAYRGINKDEKLVRSLDRIR